MYRYIFSEDFSILNSKICLEVYENQNLNHQDYFHHPKFQFTCIATFSKYSTCYLLSVYKSDKLIGYSALREKVLTVRKKNYNFLVPIGYRVAEYNYPIIHKNYINEFLNIMNKVLIDFNVHFQHVPGFFKNRILDSINNSFVSRVVENPILRDLNNDIFTASRKSTPLRRKKQLIKRFDKVEVEHVTKGITDELLNSLFELHIKRWNWEGINSKFKLNEFKDVYKKISQLKIDKIGYPILSYLKVDGAIVACHFGYKIKDKYLVQIQSRSMNDQYRSVGSILIAETLSLINSEELKIYDMGVGVEDYKYRYMNDIVSYFNILKFKSSFHSYRNRLNLK